jgi:hypothetical protein
MMIAVSLCSPLVRLALVGGERFAWGPSVVGRRLKLRAICCRCVKLLAAWNAFS